ncbi:branched-chain amino acid ABC transporter permease [Candidatus Hecatella orcuttiae]|jgi:branched-chain amino acid transport system permease protein|uniref:branched-chain amino acid ABC transporter permease n=1 Tax=Candidatus Hecatella orcuttiae TaxID=1935119 RepID=UPI002867B924|nr:branched-chain amino acid ABC transporter permease [Candidatus Hecatella orcuttiae]
MIPPEVLISGILEGSIYSLIAIGLSQIIGVMRIINYTHGDLMIFGAMISFWLFTLFGLDPLLSLVIIVPLTLGAGMFIQKFIVGPSIRKVELQSSASMVITFGLALVIMQSEFIVWSPNLRSIETSYTALNFMVGGVLVNLMRVLALLMAVAVAVLLHLTLSRTGLGRAIRACTQDREAAMMLGVNFEKTAYLTFGLSTALASVAGLLWILTHVLNPGLGIAFTVRGFIVLILGGMGSIAGPFIAGIIVGLLENIGIYVFGGVFRDTVVYVILFLVLLLRPRGILGKVEVYA